MTAYANMTAEQLQQEYQAVTGRFEALKAKNLKLDMSRGKPGKAQLDLVSDILTVLKTPEDCMDGKIDARNYGELSGLPSAKKLFAEILGCRPEEVFVGGNASLNLMYDVISKGMTHGLLHSPRPWSQEPVRKFLCPSPGYDRHFKVTESFGFELITIPMLETGPDMDAVEEAVKDPAVRPQVLQPPGLYLLRRDHRPHGAPEARRPGLHDHVGQRLLHPRVRRRLRAVPGHPDPLPRGRQPGHGL